MVAALLPYRGLHWTALELLGVSWNLRTRLKLDYSGRLRPSLQTGGTIRLGSALLGMFFCLRSNTLTGGHAIFRSAFPGCAVACFLLTQFVAD